MSKRELGRGLGRTCALVDVGAGNTVTEEARVARACEGTVGVCARRVGVAVVGPICDRGESHLFCRAQAGSLGIRVRQRFFWRSQERIR